MSEELPQSGSIEDNLPMVNYIMLHRIYDILVLLANMTAKNDEDKQQINKMIEYHDAGFLLGPGPSYTPDQADE